MTVLQTVDLTARCAERILFQGLNLSLEDEKVALVGRNGIGKSTLLSILNGDRQASSGRVERRGSVVLVPQLLRPGGSGSPGELRRLALQRAMESGSDLLLLDEPTQDLDCDSVAWLRRELERYQGGALVVTHDRRLLQDFQHFFVMLESGCRYLGGKYDELVIELEGEFQRKEERYLRRLNHLAREEERTHHLARRRRRKKQYGRCSELDRATPRSRLNQKRNDAQVSHGKLDTRRRQLLNKLRDVTRGARRALKVELPLELQMPDVAAICSEPAVVMQGVGMRVSGRLLFRDLNLSLTRQRVAVLGPNGAGKTTLLEVLTGQRQPTTGRVTVKRSRLGFIAQGAANWMREESLVQLLELQGHDAGARLVAFKFPLALGRRPLRTLSAGERVRAALIATLSARPVVDVLVLDEPANSLDILGRKALADALRAWPGGLVVAGHQHDFLSEVRLSQTLSIGGTQGEEIYL